MKNWIRVQPENGENAGSRIINVKQADELLLDITGQTGRIVSLKDGEKESLCTAGPGSVTWVWLDLLRSTDAKSMDFTCEDHYFHPVKFCFPDAGEDDAPYIVNTFLIKTDQAKTKGVPEEYERYLLSALIGFICTRAPSGKQNINSFNSLFKGTMGFVNYELSFDDIFWKEKKIDLDSKDAADYRKFKSLPARMRSQVWNSCVRRAESLGFSAEFELCNDDGEGGTLENYSSWWPDTT